MAARISIIKSILEDAKAVDDLNVRRQASFLRNLPILYRDIDYVNAYRLSPALINDLEIELQPFLKTTVQIGKGLTTRIKILCTLSFLASGSYQKCLTQNVAAYLSQPSISRAINEVVGALNNPAIVKKYIRFPQNLEERNVLKQRFYEKFKIPTIIGSVDGTFVSMVRPIENEERYYCRKGYHARNVQLITDADLNILHVDPTYGGATHDSFIFNHCAIKNHLEALTNAGEQVALLGDSGYPQRAFLMTPVAVTDASENSPEAFYNKRQMSARNSVERAIGILKGRFRCLLVNRTLHYHPDVVAKIVIACSVLHNLCNRAGMPAFELTDDVQEEEAQFQAVVQARQERYLPSHDDLAVGQLRRQELIDNLWRARYM